MTLAITPPVALAAYAGSGISGGNALMTGVNASKLAIAAFIIPYMFVLSPELLMIDATVGGLALSVFTAVLGMVAISASLIGYLADHCLMPERFVLFAGGLLMIKPGIATDLIGIVVFAVVIFLQWKRKNQKPSR